VIVVTDTSVVLNLCFLNQGRLLTDIFGTVLAPPSVRAEFQRLASLDPRFLGLTFPASIQTVAPAHIAPALVGNQRLHNGEIEALSLAVEQKADAVLMDERAGRTAATGLGLHCIGVLGVLIQAKTMGLLSAVRPLIEQLQSNACFWIAPALRQKVLNAVNE